MALTVKIRADASHFKKTIAGVEVQASGLSGVMGKLATSNLAFGAALSVAAAGAVALGAGLAFIKDASGKAAGIESLTMQFETLLGSAAKAKDRMEEIKRFAASTPFEVANLSETSKLLQTLGGDLLATGAGLRMVGDAAAIAGQPIQEVGLHFGRLFNAITSGTSAGESIGRLQELGLMTGKVKIQFEALAAAQKKGEKPILTQTQAMTLLQGVFSKTAGAMERLSTTTEGKVSNMKDAVDNLKVAFGTGFNDGLKAALDATNSFLPQLEAKFAQFGQMLGTAIKQAVDGDYQMLSAVGEVIGEAIMAGMRTTIKVGATSLLRDGIGGYVGLGGHLINDPSIKGAGKAINAMIGSAMGPRPGMAETLQGELQSGGMSSALGRVQSANLTPTWAEELERNRKLTEELVSQGKTSIAELKKAFGGKSQVMFSR
jgi:hypothetical protein